MYCTYVFSNNALLNWKYAHILVLLRINLFAFKCIPIALEIKLDSCRAKIIYSVRVVCRFMDSVQLHSVGFFFYTTIYVLFQQFNSKKSTKSKININAKKKVLCHLD